MTLNCFTKGFLLEITESTPLNLEIVLFSSPGGSSARRLRPRSAAKLSLGRAEVCGQPGFCLQPNGCSAWPIVGGLEPSDSKT